VLLYTNGSDRSFIGMRTSEILSNHTFAVHGLFPSCKHTCYVSQLEKWSVIDFYWFAATGFGIILLYFQTVVIPAFQGCFFFFFEQSFPGLLPLLDAGVFYLRPNFGPRHDPT